MKKRRTTFRFMTFLLIFLLCWSIYSSAFAQEGIAIQTSQEEISTSDEDSDQSVDADNTIEEDEKDQDEELVEEEMPSEAELPIALTEAVSGTTDTSIDLTDQDQSLVQASDATSQEMTTAETTDTSIDLTDQSLVQISGATSQNFTFTILLNAADDYAPDGTTFNITTSDANGITVNSQTVTISNRMATFSIQATTTVGTKTANITLTPVATEGTSGVTFNPSSLTFAVEATRASRSSSYTWKTSQGLNRYIFTPVVPASAASGEKTATLQSNGSYQIELQFNGKTGSQKKSREYFLVIDTSISMGYNLGTSETRLYVLKKALNGSSYTSGTTPTSGFIKEIFDKGTNTSVCLVSFNSAASVPQVYTTASGAATAVQALSTSSGTNYQSALYQTATQLKNSNADEKYVIFLSDGAPSTYGQTSSQTSVDAGSKVSFVNTMSEIVAFNDVVASTGATVYNLAYATSVAASMDGSFSTTVTSSNGTSLTYKTYLENRKYKFNYFQYIGAKNEIVNGSPATNSNVSEVPDETTLNSILANIIDPTFTMGDATITDTVNGSYFNLTGSNFSESGLQVLIRTNSGTDSAPSYSHESIQEGPTENTNTYSITEATDTAGNPKVSIHYNGALAKNQTLIVRFKVMPNDAFYADTFDPDKANVYDTNTSANATGVLKYSDGTTANYSYEYSSPKAGPGVTGFNIDKLSSSNESLTGAEFELYRLPDGVTEVNDQTPYRIITFGDDSSFFVKDIPKGTYVLVETKAPEGYTLDQTQYMFTVNEQIVKDRDSSTTDATKYDRIAVPNTNSLKPSDGNASFDLTKETLTINFVNKPQSGDLVITKTLGGNAYNANDSFTFTITGGTGDLSYSYTDQDHIVSTSGTLSFNNGSASVTVKGNATITIKDVPVSWNLTVEEQKPVAVNNQVSHTITVEGKDPFEPVSDYKTGEFNTTANSTTTVAYTNEVDASPITDSTIQNSAYIGLTIVALAMLGCAVYFKVKRHR